MGGGNLQIVNITLKIKRNEFRVLYTKFKIVYYNIYFIRIHVIIYNNKLNRIVSACLARHKRISFGTSAVYNMYVYTAYCIILLTTYTKVTSYRPYYDIY